ncbi:hypothetical protein U9M48_004569 [Paspalum notatum var. saurae]|uniref:Bowman-Birk serine protease inhibitors family domain-containing protein n=1 Tax=Paspalum notatum var. saurae TaxID=547442 RepID=A0AAQ3PV12_PASNO
MNSNSMGTSPILVLLGTMMLVAGFNGATASRPCDHTTSTLRLPSSPNLVTKAGVGQPWECCDWIVRDPNMRPTRWQCNDVVAKCSADCRDCVELQGGVGYICRDWVTSLWQPPVCTPRPWDCCDVAVCDRKLIPDCVCADVVETCPSNCQKCAPVELDGGAPRYRCLDSFHGYPEQHKHHQSGEMKSSAMGTGLLVLAVLVAGFDATAAVRHWDTASDTAHLHSSGDGGLPWECCDFVVRDPNFRPGRWQCNDVVDKCSPNCRECAASPAGNGYVCRDWIVSIREPPVCTPRPWDCCDQAVCTRDYIPFCQCADMVESCSTRCKQCELVQADPPRYRCLDSFFGYPGPKCTAPWISMSSN